jgi:ribosomal protein S18 acetylase RimI-like enzyme
MYPNVKLEPAKPEDLDTFLSIWLEGLRPHIERLHKWDEEAEREYNKKQFNSETLQRIILDDKIVGFINLRPADYSTISLGLFCIHKNYRNMKVGTTAFELALKQCAGRCVFLNVLKLSPAVHLYKRFNFKYSHSDDISHYYMKEID